MKTERNGRTGGVGLGEVSKSWAGKPLGFGAGLLGAGLLLGVSMWAVPSWWQSSAKNQATAEAGAWRHTARAAETFYTCPMHPTIIEKQPGACPICGMDLVAKDEAEGGEAGALEHSSGPSTAVSSESGPAVSSDQAGGVPGGAKKGKIKYWVAPMDPTYISDKPGKSPMGMDLVPVYEEESGGSSAGLVRIDPVVVQNMGVRIAPVERGALSRHVRTIGEVDVAENEISVVNLRYSGWVEKIWVDETGQYVKKGQRLFSIYSPELVSAQEEYLLAVNTAGKDSALARSAAKRLELWDIPRWHLDRIVADGNAHRRVVVTAPQSGYVLHKNIVQGARVEAGADLYRIGNLQTIWVNAEVYEFDAPWVKEGQSATMELSFQRGKQWQGRVAYIYPTLNKRSRTLTVRLEFPNPGIELKPGMFATVRITSQRKENVLAIPTEAILDSGERQLVFVAKGMGRYEAREVVTGLVGSDHRTEVLSGLEEGERVVVSGQFLLDSESQLQEAVAKLLEARLQYKEKAMGPASGGDERTEELQETREGTSYWTCSMHPTVVEDGPGTCPICGMNLVEKRR